MRYLLVVFFASLLSACGSLANFAFGNKDWDREYNLCVRAGMDVYPTRLAVYERNWGGIKIDSVDPDYGKRGQFQSQCVRNSCMEKYGNRDCRKTTDKE